MYPTLHKQYIACVYPKYCDYIGGNFQRRTFSFETRKLFLLTFYTPVKDRTYYVITHGERVGWQAASPILCPEYIAKTMLATVMKLHGWIDLIKAECSAQEP